MRQAGVVAAAALLGLESAEERMRTDHQRTKKLAQGTECSIIAFGDPLTLSYRARRSKIFLLTATKAGLRRLASFGGSLVVLMSHFEATRGLFWDGPRNFEPWSDDEDDT
ncbi:hypothetical protein AVEN_165552-1 [Araneus ventricosus]|uniref:Uncharacterized protein n=1 Tax=Araneus ventricosus TaxID=182803 RepID=A0A4Y2WAI4_ARAVE|nr:hypothetical protein AVEN_165552-1 [Araneus ventricosus]